VKEAIMNGTLKILVIDDDQDFRVSVRSLLESQGYVVLEADSGKDGLRKVVEEKPDIIVLDIMMECDTEGYGVNQAIKYQDAYADYRNIPIIMTSSIELSPDERYPMAGELDMIRPDFYLTKPLDIPKFLEVVKTGAALRPSHGK
jgi:CheY-like chemotaxis protein